MTVAREMVHRIQASFDAYLSQLPEALRCASSDLNARIAFSKGTSASWSSRFSPMVAAFPSLHKLEIQRHNDSELELAHFLLLIYSFCDDRILDGQVRATYREHIFLNRILLDATAILLRSGRGTVQHAKVLDRLHAYFNSQVEEYGTTGNITHRQIKTLASARAGCGLLAVLSKTHLAGVDARLQRIIVNAFDCLTTGLQWADDMEDWQDDLSTGDENLLVLLLNAKHGQTGSRSVSFRPVQSSAEVGLLLLDSGVFEEAESYALRWLEYASHRYGKLGYTEVCRSITDMQKTIIRRRPILQEQAEASALRAALHAYRHSIDHLNADS